MTLVEWLIEYFSRDIEKTKIYISEWEQMSDAERMDIVVMLRDLYLYETSWPFIQKIIDAQETRD